MSAEQDTGLAEYYTRQTGPCEMDVSDLEGIPCAFAAFMFVIEAVPDVLKERYAATDDPDERREIQIEMMNGLSARRDIEENGIPELFEPCATCGFEKET